MATARTIVVALLIWIAGCNTLATKEAVVGCQVADGATTLYALHHGAIELSPIPVPALLALKVFIVAWALGHTKEEWEAESKGARATIAVAGCIPAINNGVVISRLPK